ncbi:hypothetical protein L1987_55647 [Smallanthus sonchifolius]|uniref:Uncharacterized protein n=1 Tax=Smallanthus sonchifolius TaxID=185202 RepID=A0ACB9EB67_9ASTR|nr:hypothetical protein L1987_55647 [Smallanthus sonchifolius]
MSIQDFYGAMSDLWDQLALTESAALKGFKPYIVRRRNNICKRNSTLQKPPQQNISGGQFSSRTSTSAGSFKPPPFTAVATPPFVEMSKPPSALDPQVFEQFRQFLAANPTAMSAARLSSSGTLGSTHSEGDGIGRRVRDLYVLEELKVYVPGVAASSVDLSSFRLSPLSSEFYIWHSRLRHVSASHLKFFVSSGALGQLQTCDISDCSGCKLVKFFALPFDESISHSVAPFDIVHSDVWGPSPCFRCDLGGEYTSNDFTQLLASDGTIHQSSCTDTPQQNGVAERKHRHLMETACSFLLSAEVPSVFWGETLLTAQHVINRILTSHNDGMSPFESLFGERPDYGELQVFRCTCFALRPHVEQDKLANKSALCVFLGYASGPKGYGTYASGPKGYGTGQKGYRCFDHMIDPFASDTDIPTPDVPDSSIDPNMPAPDTSVEHDVPVHEPSTSSGTNVDSPPPPRKSTRACKSTQLPDFAYSAYSASFSSFIAGIHHLSEPESYKEAVSDPLWQNAMAEELTALHQTHT